MACVVIVVDWEDCDDAVDAVGETDWRLEQGGTGNTADLVICGDQSASETVLDAAMVELHRDMTASGRGMRLGRSS